MYNSANLISAIIPVYNREKYIAEAIDSVLAQTYNPIEIIVVDDGSTDKSAGIVKEYQNSSIRYTFQSNQGIGAARNTGTDLAQGSYFAFLDSDDLWTPDKISLQMKAFDKDPKLDMVFGHVVQFHDSHLGTIPEGKDQFVPGTIPSTLLIQRDSFFKVGKFSSQWKIGEFVDWYARALETGLKSLMLPDVVAKRRIHDTNIGIVERKSQKDYLNILRSSLERRKGKPD